MKFNKIFSAACVLTLVSGAEAVNISATDSALKLAPVTVQAKANTQVKVTTPAKVRTERHSHSIESRDRGNSDNTRAPRRNQFMPETDKQQTSATSSKSKSVISSKSIQVIGVAAVEGECDVNALVNSSSSAMVNALVTYGFDCVNDMYGASDNDVADLFSSSNLIAAASEAESRSASYNGGGDDVLRGLFYYIRIGWYFEYYNSGVSYNSSVTAATGDAIDAFVNNSHVYDNNNDHGYVLQEVAGTMNNSEQWARYIPVVKGLLSRWNQDYAASPRMGDSLFNLMSILYLGRRDADFIAAVSTDTQLVELLADFSQNTWMIGTDDEFLINESGYELGLLKKHGGSIQNDVDAALTTIFNDYEMVGYGDGIWLGAAKNAVDYGDCNQWDICGYHDELKAQILPQITTCSSTLIMYSQDLTTVQKNSACDALAAEEVLFHSLFPTNNTPVADDYNEQLNLLVYDTKDDYSKYAGHIVSGANTNNGGLYLEGNPATQGNIPIFMAYEIAKANPAHYIWNLEHEYVHYLDGRYNAWGRFSEYPDDTVWFGEGVAEYVANPDGYQQGYDTITDGSLYDLATVFRTTYNNSQDQIYSWGYLATRFMYEEHHTQLEQWLTLTRAGDWSAAGVMVTGWGSTYSNGFDSWIEDLAATTGSNVSPIANINGPYSADAGQNINFSSNGSYDPDGSIGTYSWNFGDNTPSDSSANPSHSYDNDGSYTVTLTVEDLEGAETSTSTTVSIGIEPTNKLFNNVGQNISGAQGSETHYNFEIPANASNLVVAISGGSGDADLYVQYGSAPSSSSNDCYLNLGGNNETCDDDLDVTQSGTWHVMVRGWSGYDNVTLVVSWDEDGGCTSDCGVVTALDENLSGTQSSETHYTVSVPAGASNLIVAISGGSGDADLYVNYGSVPTTGSGNDCFLNIGGNDESCDQLTTQSGTWYIMVRGYSSYDNVALLVTWDEGTDPTSPPTDPSSGLQNGSSTMVSGMRDDELMYSFELPAGASNLSVAISGGTGDADLYVNYGSEPTTGSGNDCFLDRAGNSENCNALDESKIGTWYIMVRGYSDFDGVSLTVNWD